MEREAIEFAYDVRVWDAIVLAEMKSIVACAEDFCIGQNRGPSAFGRQVKFGEAVFDYNKHISITKRIRRV